MAKKGMKRIQITPKPPKNEHPPVPEIQGKAKHTKTPANPIIAGTEGPDQKVYHNTPYHHDLASDNLSNNTTFADLQDR